MLQNQFHETLAKFFSKKIARNSCKNSELILPVFFPRFFSEGKKAVSLGHIQKNLDAHEQLFLESKTGKRTFRFFSQLFSQKSCCIRMTLFGHAKGSGFKTGFFACFKKIRTVALPWAIRRTFWCTFGKRAAILPIFGTSYPKDQNWLQRIRQ